MLYKMTVLTWLILPATFLLVATVSILLRLQDGDSCFRTQPSSSSIQPTASS
jgi:hypothetical protein